MGSMHAFVGLDGSLEESKTFGRGIGVLHFLG